MHLHLMQWHWQRDQEGCKGAARRRREPRGGVPELENTEPQCREQHTPQRVFYSLGREENVLEHIFHLFLAKYL